MLVSVLHVIDDSILSTIQVVNKTMTFVSSHIKVGSNCQKSDR